MKHDVKIRKPLKKPITKVLKDNILDGWEYNIIQVSMEHNVEMHTDLVKDGISNEDYEAAKFSLDVLIGLCLAQEKLNNIYGHWNNSLFPSLRNNIRDWKIQIEELKNKDEEL